jgi:hypothetical protein
MVNDLEKQLALVFDFWVNSAEKFLVITIRI